MPTKPARVMFVYWGRRGMSQFALEVAQAARCDPSVSATFSVSRQNESYAAFAELGEALFPIETFASNAGAVVQAWRLPGIRSRLVERLRRDRTQAVIELMPHVWSSYLMPAVQAEGIRYVSTVHDAETHPGDRRSGIAKQLLDRAAFSADLVLTLSEAVAGRLSATGNVPRSRLFTILHPDLSFAGPIEPQPPAEGAPFRLLFLGRVMSYKALPMFLDAVEMLRGDGVPVEVGLYGDGPLGKSEPRLKALGAEVVNRWLRPEEIGAVMSRFHALVLSHTEASQSGIVAAALGSGLPVVATPVGGLIEQITHGQTGMLAPRADAPSLATAIRTLVDDPELYRSICRIIAATREERSMRRFVEDCVSHALFAGK